MRPCLPALYWPRTEFFRAIFADHGRMAPTTLAFSLRTASAANAAGGSMATIASNWNRWLGTMSRRAPVLS
ncbi:hypothetical protein D9M73_154970 [compost metagenome]